MPKKVIDNDLKSSQMGTGMTKQLHTMPTLGHRICPLHTSNTMHNFDQSRSKDAVMYSNTLMFTEDIHEIPTNSTYVCLCI